MKKIANLLEQVKDKKRSVNLHTEFQQFGVYLADELQDPKHYSLYIKLAKTYPRVILQEALTFVKGSTNAKSKGRLFMWKLKQLKDSLPT